MAIQTFPPTGTFSSVNLTSGTITATPTGIHDIANKEYVDATAGGINFHESVDHATTTALPTCTYNNGSSGVGATLTASANGALSIDGFAVSTADRVLIKNQVNQAQNGVYVVTQTGSAGAPFILTRASDFNTAGSGPNQIDAGDFFLVTTGTVNANTAWVQQTPLPITIGTTAIVFVQFGGGTGGSGTVTSVDITPGTGISATGGPITTSGSITVTNTAPDQTVVLTNGTGISATGTYPNFTITNTAPDQTVVLTQGGTTTITGTYPNFTISSADQYVGTVTSVSGTGTINGLTLSGTVTSSGSLTLGGTLSGIANSALTNSSITINGSAISLGDSVSVGTVTSVAALTLGTSGTDLSSTVATGTSTPVITLNVPTASATNRGALSPTDWSTFNGKQAALVSGTNIKTINGSSILGSGDLTVSGTVTGFWAATVDKLTSTQASSSTTLGNVTQLVEAMVANGVYTVNCFVTFQSAATTTGLNLGFTSPSGSICQLEVVVPITSTAAASQLRTIFPNAAATNTGNVIGTGVTAINSNHTARISGIVTCGATPGNFQVQFASEVNASAVTLQIGSSLVMQRIA